MECSSLNSHLYSKNIINSPSCSCGGFESAHHFFFTCPIYRHIRTIYLSNVLQTHNTHELLYGKETATDLENEALFLKVQDFLYTRNDLTSIYELEFNVYPLSLSLPLSLSVCLSVCLCLSVFLSLSVCLSVCLSVSLSLSLSLSRKWFEFYTVHIYLLLLNAIQEMTRISF